MVSTFVHELFHTGVYKRSQGRIARQATFAALAILVSLGMWRLTEVSSADPIYRFGVPGLLWVLGMWISFRVVNFPAFADFLISVEAEMNKVSWPSRRELFRSSVVVMFTIFALAAVLFAYDLFWQQLLKLLGILV
jgi:preprotein translocase subunit SecE